MSKEGMLLAARFAWPAKKCTGSENKQLLANCIVTNQVDSLEPALHEYQGMLRYLGILATGLHLDIFDYDVVHAYWLGGKELAEVPQKNIIPLHLRKVLGEARTFHKQNRFDISKVNSCMVRWGIVTNMTENTLDVNLHSLQGSYEQLTQTIIPETVHYTHGFLPKIKPGETVAVHDGWAVVTIIPEEEKELAKWTTAVLDNY